ncbi:MAG: 50S ribosomal protein L18e [Nitrososphaerales archaeon]
MKRGKNPLRLKLIKLLKRKAKEEKASLWRSVSEFLEKPRSKEIVVNLGKISRLTKKDDLVIVPGKVLGSGNLDHALVIGAYSFSKKAREKIKEAKGKTLSLDEFVEKYPKGSGVLIIGG